MKFFYPTLLGFALCVLSSCSPEPLNPDALVSLEGTWELESATGTGHNVTHYKGEEVPATFSTRTVSPTDYALTFTPQGRVFSTGTFTEEVTGTFQGETSTRIREEKKLVGAGVWKLQGRQLSMGTDHPEEIQLRIVTLSESELVMEYQNVFTTESRNGHRIDEEQRVIYILHRN
ncbi:lipocalin family protein [Lewinella sp. IMCC34183]|uniref:lipocalin family protein n=1 Tax=Lewinella sp. IMCC34183 TaxID=2248762 RepID=UPI000E284748|nr:lipocalin family protein [Lewinella sp. IMCC34183]